MGFHSEQGDESIHAIFKSLKRTYSCVRNPVERLRSALPPKRFPQHHSQACGEEAKERGRWNPEITYWTPHTYNLPSVNVIVICVLARAGSYQPTNNQSLSFPITLPYLRGWLLGNFHWLVSSGAKTSNPCTLYYTILSCQCHILVPLTSFWEHLDSHSSLAHLSGRLTADTFTLS